MKINVVDGIMSVGKSSFAIDMINKDNDNTYLYITPFLPECDRVVTQCSSKKFTQPNGKFGSKTKHFKEMLKKNKNIVSTHSLFKGVDDETRDILQSSNYILILDEVLDVVEKVNISSKDLENILSKYVEVNEKCEMVWTDRKYRGKYDEYKNLCDEGCLMLINNTVVMWSFPAEIFKYFKEVYILTYLFDFQVQKYYFDFYDIEYNYKTIDRNEEGYFLTEKGCSNYEIEKKKQAKELIEIYQGKSNVIGNNKYDLSKSWYDKATDKQKKDLSNNLFNYFKNTTKTKSKQNGWTTFKNYIGDISRKGYTNGFIPVNCRATNEHQDKCSLAYPVNRFIDPYFKHMFELKNIDVNEDGWALSEMLQWIWRGSIRKNEPMKLYIPSYRMRNLFERWLNNEI